MKTINRLGEIIGEASMCWSETPKGVFESTQASKLVKELETIIEQALKEQKEEMEELLPALFSVQYPPKKDDVVYTFTANDAQKYISNLLNSINNK